MPGGNGINRQGNRRGMAKGSRDGLQRGRAVARDKRPRGEDVGHRRTCAGLKGKAAKAIAKRIKIHLVALDEEPNLLGSIVAATMVADMQDANRFLENGWGAVHSFLEDGDAELMGQHVEPDALAAAKAAGKAGRALLVLPLIDELRKWSKLTAELALRVAEIHARTKEPESPDDYLRNRYGDNAKDPAPERPAIPDGLAEITIEDATGVDDA